MNTKTFTFVALSLGLFISACSFFAKKDQVNRFPSSDGIMLAGLDGWKSTEENKQLWQEYCVGDSTAADIPRFRYENPNPMVQKAVENIKKVSDKSYFLYTEVEEVYGLRELGSKKDSKKPLIKPAYEIPAGVSLLSNAYLVILCGEFRDRATMIQEKLNWIANLYKLPTQPQSSFGSIDPEKSPWSQMSAHSYSAFLQFSRALWFARQPQTPAVNLGTFSVRGAVEGMSVCQMKYIFTKYIHPGVAFDSISSYETGFADFKTKCSTDDVSDYYSFRGDTNFKPYSPEGNAMLFRGRFMASLCKNPSQTKKPDIVSDADCKSYYTSPFQSRWAAARAGLAAWMFYDPKHESVFSNTKSQLTMFLHFDGANRPLNFATGTSAEDPSVGSIHEKNFSSDWLKQIQNGDYQMNDIGFNKFVKMGASDMNSQLAYTRIKNAVDRHTDWYTSGYNDLKTKRSGTQAYSPFVASSYEMYESNGFVNCGITIPCIPSEHDDRKHWMFVFRVKGENWYRTQDLQKARPIDFSRMWFDETSFGTTGLAIKEHAWDRLGTAVEGEYDSILYLHNITTSGTVADDGLPQ